jgi:polar amino acid transport system substrate-binding protein
MTIDPAIVQAFTPKGVLRASINLGNPILAHADQTTGAPKGVSVDLARAFAERLGVELELVVFDAAGKSVEAVAQEQADIGFFAIDPVRAAHIAFTDAYVLIEGSYLVREDSPLQHNDQVDQGGLRVMVGKGSAYDLYLTRALKNAEILRAPTSPTVVRTFLEQEADVAAGVKQQLEADSREHGALRLLPGRFMVIRQAMGTPKSRGDAAADTLSSFVEALKANGFVADAIRRHSVEGASVAPLKSIATSSLGPSGHSATQY